MELIFTLHAKQQMIERGIGKQQVIDALRKGSKVKQSDGLLASYGYIRVAYKIRMEKYIIKTVMLK